MSRAVSRVVLAALAIVCLAAGVATAQTSTTSTESKSFEIIAVDGNRLVVKLPEGTRELMVPADFRFTVNGQPLAARELKPGMVGTATITTTTTVTPVTVTEVKNGTVLQKSGGSIIVRTDEGFKMFTQGDVDKRGVTIVRDGKPATIAELRTNDRLSATIVTSLPPTVLTEKEVELRTGGGKATTARPPRPARRAAGRRAGDAAQDRKPLAPPRPPGRGVAPHGDEPHRLAPWTVAPAGPSHHRAALAPAGGAARTHRPPGVDAAGPPRLRCARVRLACRVAAGRSPGPRVPRQHIHDERSGRLRPPWRGGESRLGSLGQLRRRLGKRGPGRIGRWYLRPALRQLRRPARPRVPCQHLHHEPPRLSVRGLGRLRQLRRRLERRSSGRSGRWCLRSALRQLRRPARPRVPRQHLHHGPPGRWPSVAADTAGNFVVVWHSHSQDGNGYGVFGQRYDSSGAPLGLEFRVNTYTTNDQRGPSVASDTAGNFVVVWTSAGRTARASASSASATTAPAPRSAPSSASTPTPRTTKPFRPWPRTAPATSSSPGQATGRTARSLASSASATPAPAAPLGPEFRVNTYTTNIQSHPSVASDSAGNFVVAWGSVQDGPGLAGAGVFGQRYASSGAPLGPEFRVNTYTTSFQSLAVRGLGQRRQLRRRLAQQRAGRLGHWRLRPALRFHCAPGGSRRHQDRRPDDSRRGPSHYVHDRRRERRTASGQRRDGHGYGAPGHPRGELDVRRHRRWHLHGERLRRHR